MQSATARKLLAEAGYPDGKGFPPVTLLYNINLLKEMYAEAIQQMWQQNLGIQVDLQAQEWPVFNQNRTLGEFQLSYYGYCADYFDPMTFLECWTTGNPNNCSGYSNPQFDALVNKAKNTVDQGVRMQIMHEAEAVVVNDMPALPLNFEKANYLKQPCVKGLVLSGGLISFKYVWIEP